MWNCLSQEPVCSLRTCSCAVTYCTFYYMHTATKYAWLYNLTEVNEQLVEHCSVFPVLRLFFCSSTENSHRIMELNSAAFCHRQFYTINCSLMLINTELASCKWELHGPLLVFLGEYLFNVKISLNLKHSLNRSNWCAQLRQKSTSYLQNLWWGCIM